jgi:hypothetical protein
VSGSDEEDGNLVHGAVLIEGKAGFGSLKRIDSSTVEIAWSTNRKIIIATDSMVISNLIVEKNSILFSRMKNRENTPKPIQYLMNHIITLLGLSKH